MSDQFTFTDKHKRSLLMLSGFGIVLMLLGFVLSNQGGGHGGGHDAGHDAEHKEGTQPSEHKGGDHGAHPADFNSGSGVVEQGHFGGSGDQPSGDSAHVDSGSVESNPTPHPAPASPLPPLTKADSTEPWHLAFPDRAYMYPGNSTPMAHAEGVEQGGTKSKFGGAILMAGWFFMGISVFGIFFIAFGYVANAGWFVTLKRIPETFYNWLPFAAILILIAFFGFGNEIWTHWVAIPEGADAIIDGKRGFLNTPFFLISVVGVLGLWYFFGHKFRQSSLKEDSEGGMAQYKYRKKMATIFLPLFAFPFSMIAFQWLMSIETHWFSTMYGVYCFAGIFISGMTMIMFITSKLKEQGLMEEVSPEHLHDMGKFMFAFSVFWAYIFLSQFLLIWYANMPEETSYYRLRYDQHKFLFFVNIIVNFFLPFLVLMTRNAKRNFSSMKTIGVLILIGRFIDLYMLITPGVMHGHSGVGYFIMCGGALLTVAGAFLFIVYSSIAKAPLMARKHPYFEESVHHNTGV